jgi:EAL domain-containing protein (putative c-di-GMP-specific phosphodiesterase class I)
MHRTKAGGRDSVGLFDATGHHALEVQAALASRLADAMANDELDLFYQPVVDPHGRAVGVEGLLRWRHDGVLMPPTEFIAGAEASGLIVPMGRWVIERACRDLRALREASGNDRLYASFNLSAQQLRDADLAAHVGFCLSRYGLDPSSLVVELTESAIVDDPRLAARVLAALRDLGARVAIDDFGTGYSSLAYLRHIPADILKIDRSLVTDLERDERAVQLLRGIVTLAHDLGMLVTVEGVEDARQLAIARDAGGDAIQGYIVSPPRDLRAAGAVLAVLADPAGERDASARAASA